MQPPEELKGPITHGLIGHGLDRGGVHLDGDVIRHVPKADLDEPLGGLGLVHRLALGVLRHAAGYALLGGGEAGPALRSAAAGSGCGNLRGLRRLGLLLVFLVDALQNGRREGHPPGPGGLIPLDEGLEMVRAAGLRGNRHGCSSRS